MAGVEEGEKLPLQPTAPPPPRDKCLRFTGYGARVWGVVTMAVMWAATVTSLQGQYDVPTYAPYYLLAASVLVTFFEITWILDKIACCVRVGWCCICWTGVLWIENWRKFLLYACLSVPLFLEGLRFVIGIASGFCMVILACLYLVKTFSKIAAKRSQPRAPVQQPTAVRHEMAVQTDANWVGDARERDAQQGGQPPPAPAPQEHAPTREQPEQDSEPSRAEQ